MSVINDTIAYYKNEQTQFILKQFMNQVRTFFEENPLLNNYEEPIIHSIKTRFKDSQHLHDKLKRKQHKGVVVKKEDLFAQVNDLIGIRILHLYLDQFELIHQAIMENIKNHEWYLAEEPKAYTWDPETENTFKKLKLKTLRKDSFYTSVHYVIKRNKKRDSVTCEIQVRTLFEEIWGEIDHSINYPKPTHSIPCKEQLRVLSKLVSTGTRLADSIFRSHKDFNKDKINSKKITKR